MAFVDRVRFRVEAGSGGRGAISFRREKFVPEGGPDGGDGAWGGDIILRTTTSRQDFSHFVGTSVFKAESGGNGGRAKCDGKTGRDLILDVPPGTVVRDHSNGLVLKDLDANELELVVAAGGQGGRGNRHFATSTKQVPRFAEPGKPGEIRTLELELKLIADVGLIGLPNAGKSTLLSKISQAQPKIAPYPFTTLYPQLGVTEMGLLGRLVVADIPGLIKGAHKGVGLGDEFLRHIERSRCLVHVIDAAAPDPVHDYEVLRAELEAYGRTAHEKKVLVVANKIDLPEAAAGVKKLTAELGRDVIPLSAQTGKGIDKLITRLKKFLPI
jgi:GTP-binding protein